jgi:hypothetical protein
MEDDAKRTVSDNFALRVGQVSGFSGEAILDLFANYFCGAVSGTGQMLDAGIDGRSPPILKLEKAVGLFCDIAWLFRGLGTPLRRGCYREYGGLALSTLWAGRLADGKRAGESSFASRAGELMKRTARTVQSNVVWGRW